MEAAKTIEALTVFNRPFFVNELLRSIQPDPNTPEIFAAIVKESRAFDLNTMLTAMTRQIDLSGIVPNLAGVYENPQDILEALMNLGHVQLLKIARLDEDLQEEIFNTLRGSADISLRALLVLDEAQREVISQLLAVRQQSPLALALRQATEESLKALYRNPSKLSSPIFAGVVSYEEQSVMFRGEPHICYHQHVESGGVGEVWQFFVMPKLEGIQLPKPFEKYRVGEILNEITPKAFRRGSVDDDQFDPRTPAGYIGLLGKVGGALARLIARQIKKNHQIREQLMRDEAFASALYELFYY